MGGAEKGEEEGGGGGGYCFMKPHFNVVSELYLH